MNKTANSVLDEYIKEVTDELQVSKALLLAFKKKFRKEVYAFAKEKEFVSYPILVNRFGFPKNIAKNFFSREDYNELLASAKKQELIWKISAVLGVIAAIIVFLLICYMLRDSNVNDNIYA